MGGWRRLALVGPDEWRPAGWSVCLPLLVFPCTIKSRSCLLAPAHLGGPGKRAVKRLWCGVESDYTCHCPKLNETYRQTTNQWFKLGDLALASES